MQRIYNYMLQKLFALLILAVGCMSSNAQYTFNMRLGSPFAFYSGIDTAYTDFAKWSKKWDKAYRKFDEATLNNLAYSEYRYCSKNFRNDEDKSMMKIAYSHFETAGDKMGDKLALCNLGLFHFYGIHDEVDYEKAAGYFMQSANRGCKIAKYCLGYCYQYGKGVQISLNKAKRLYEEAASQLINEKLPLRALGALYANQGDYNGAIYWFTKVLQIKDYKTDFEDIRNLGLCYLAIKDYDKAVVELTKAAEAGNSICQFELGNLFYNGQGVEKNYSKAVYWFERAARIDKYWQPLISLGECYYYGYGVTKDLSKALEMFEKAALEGASVAQREYGLLCLNDNYKLYDKSEHYMLLAANQGDLKAIAILGKEYYEGTHYQRNYEKAIEYLNKAIDRPTETVLYGVNLSNEFRGYALHTLASCYRYGRGVKMDEEHAKRLEEEASKYGNTDAHNVLDWIQSMGGVQDITEITIQNIKD